MACRSVLRYAVFMISLCSLAYAQRTTGSVVGIVTDSTGARVPAARIVATNTETGIERASSSESTGNYRVPSLPPGRYKVAAEASGFRRSVSGEFDLQVDQDVRLDFSLLIGDIKDEVTVTTEAPLVNTETGALGTVIESKKLTDMPANGRSPFWLSVLIPGVSASNFSNPNQIWVNGSRVNQAEVALDGGTSNLPTRGNFGEGVPVIDSLGEVKVQTNAYAAEFGRGAAIINITTKSGTNQFHGNAYEFFRNDALNANNFFNNKLNRPKPVVRLNIFGASLGGPIRRDRTFFFFLYEGERQRNPSTTIGDVPSPAMRTGDFSGPGLPVIYDPASTQFNPAQNRYVRQAFSGNRIPSSRFDSVASKALTYMAAPNYGLPTAFSQNVVSTESGIINRLKLQPRIDHKFSDKHFLFGRLKFQNDYRTKPHAWPGNSPADPNYQWQDANTRHIVLSDTYVASGRTVNDFRAAFWRGFYPVWDNGMFKDYAGQLGLKNSTTTAFPSLNMSSGASYSMKGTGGLYQSEETTEFTDALTHTRGKHTFKMGIDLRWSRVNQITGGSTSSGSYTFNGVFTRDLVAGRNGMGFADYLLGIPSSYSITTRDLRYGARKPLVAWYIQDDWKISSRLTLNIGVRDDLEYGWAEVRNRYANFSPTVINPYNNRPGALIFAGEDGAPARMSGARFTNFAPRFGLAYTPSADKRTVIRAGGGFFYVPNYSDSDFGGGSGLGYVATASATVTDQVTPAFTLVEGPPKPVLPPHSPSLGVGQGVTWVLDNVPTEVMYQYNLTIARELPGRFNLEASYVGTRGVHLLYGRAINQLLPGQLGPGDITSRRPWPQYSGVNAKLHDGVSRYNALQAKLEKRYSNGLTWLLSYTFSKSLDNSSDTYGGDTLQNAYDIRSNYGQSSFDIKHNLVSSISYELPFGAGRPLLNRGWKSAVLGGWQVNVISYARSGLPFAVNMDTNTANAGANTQRPDRLRNGSISSPSIDKWFDTTAFVSPGQYRFGNAGRNFLCGDGLASFDISTFKNNYFRTPLNERTNVQLRVEMFNALNMVNFANPNGAVGNANFGKVSSTSVDPRQIQLALKLIF